MSYKESRISHSTTASFCRWLRAWSLILLGFILSTAVARAASPAPPSTTRLPSWLDPRTSPFIPLPEVTTDPNGDTTVGFLPVWLFTNDRRQIRHIVAPDVTYNPSLGTGGTFRFFSYPSTDTQWYVVGGGAEQILRRFDAAYSTGITRQQRWSLDTRIFFERDPTERFYGIGNSTSSNAETNYTTEQGYVEARLGWNLNPVWQVAGELRPRFVRIRRGAFGSLPFIGDRFTHQPGLRSNYELFMRLSISYDTRDSVLVPTRGSQLTLFAGGADRALLSSVSYASFGLEGRHYTPLNQRMTLASHLALRYLPGGRRVPFWAMSRLGGDRSLLGYRQPLRSDGDGRFIDHNLFAVNIELRTRVLSLDLFTTKVTLELAPFVDVGRVSHNLGDNLFRHLHAAGGLGFRGIAEPFIVGYVDIGYGGNGVSVFSGLNYPF